MIATFKKISIKEDIHKKLKADKKRFGLKSIGEVILAYIKYAKGKL